MSDVNERKLPDGWRHVKIKEICELSYGSSLPSQNRTYGDYPVYGSNGIIGTHTNGITDTPVIIIGRKGSIGEVHYSQISSWPIDTTYYVDKLSKEVDSLWLYFVLRYLNLKELNKAAAIPGLNRDDVYALTIGLPPLVEQKRIATILTEQMEAVEKAKAAAEARLKAAKELPAAYLREIFESPEAKKWDRKPIGEVSEITARLVDPKDKRYSSLPHVFGNNIESGMCRLTYLNSAEKDGMTSGKYLFEPGCVLYSKLRPYLRKALVVDFKGVCSADMYPIIVNPELIMPEYLAWHLVSDEFTAYSDEQSRRARMPKLNRDQLFSYKIPIPKIGEQIRLIRQLKERIAAINDILKASQEELAGIDLLPAKLLRQAFSGEL